MSPIPVIETERMILRGWCGHDLDALADFFGDERNGAFIGGTKDRAQSWRQLATFAGHWALMGFGPFAMTLKDGGETIGYCGPWEPAGKHDEPEITYGLRSGYHRRGYMTEAARACVEYAFDHLKWPTVQSFVDKGNSASLGVVRKLGAKLDCETTLYGTVPVQIWRYPSLKSAEVTA
ncbi:MAG: GNAT family N-acetyltransferase [Pseudomonadota bacterium]